jgi:membrane fusion protein, multidrug efflux system
MQKQRIIPKVIIALAISSAVGWWYWQKQEASAQANNSSDSSQDKRGGKSAEFGGKRGEKLIPVVVAEVVKGDIRVIQTALGTATPSAVVTVSSRVNGQLTRVLFKEGQLVEKGELLAEIDPRPFLTALTQVQGQATRNQALLKNSQIDLERFKTLQSQDSIASQQVDAQASLVQQYQGTVQADQGLVENANLQLSFTRITSPISGRIGLRQVDGGNNITTTNPIAVINAVHPIHVVFTLPEDRVADLIKQMQVGKQAGKSLPVEVWDKANSRLLTTGHLESLDNQIDTTSGTVKIKAQFANVDNALFPNQFVNVRLLSNTLRDVKVLPSTAIQQGSGGAYVYRIRPLDKGSKSGAETVVVQGVKLGQIDGDQVVVLEGLNIGDQVVVSGIDKLKDNAKVVISSANGQRKSITRENGSGKGKGHRPSQALESSPEHADVSTQEKILITSLNNAY